MRSTGYKEENKKEIKFIIQKLGHIQDMKIVVIILVKECMQK